MAAELIEFQRFQFVVICKESPELANQQPCRFFAET